MGKIKVPVIYSCDERSKEDSEESSVAIAKSINSKIRNATYNHRIIVYSD
jgi:hypothetical protein